MEHGTIKAKEDRAIYKAMGILNRRLAGRIYDEHTGKIQSPDDVKNFLLLHLGTKEREVFSVLFLDARNRLISFEKMFYGSITECSVYPREVVKQALLLNAAGVIFAHNHPSGDAIASSADKNITDSLKSALAFVEVKVLDHFIVGSERVQSFAEDGLISFD